MDEHFKKGPISPFEFDEAESVIRLEIPEVPVSGWTMKHLNLNKVFFLLPTLTKRC